LELDPDLAEAHYFNAMIAHLVEWNWEKSEKEFLKALAINPNDSLSRICYSQLLAAVLHRNDEALAQAELAFSLDPLNPIMKWLYAATLMATGDSKTSLSLAEEAAAADPSNIMANSCIIMAAYRLKEYDKVLRAEKYVLPIPIEEDTFKEIERIYRESGIISAYEEILKRLEKFAENNYIQFLEMTTDTFLRTNLIKPWTGSKRDLRCTTRKCHIFLQQYIIWIPCSGIPGLLPFVRKWTC
jgi:tetratricopeptide (TPR) repeat protein